MKANQILKKTAIFSVPFRSTSRSIRKKYWSMLCCLMTLTVLFGAIFPVCVLAAENETVVSDSNLVQNGGSINDGDTSPTEDETGMNDAADLSQDNDTDDGIADSLTADLQVMLESDTNGTTGMVEPVPALETDMYSEGTITVTLQDGVMRFTGSGTLTQSCHLNAKSYFGVSSSEYPTVEIGGEITEIGESAFYTFGIKKLVIGSSVKTIGELAFGQAQNLESVEFGSGLVTIGKQAFWNCFALKDAKIPHSVTTIGVEAFAGCISMTSVTISSGITTINEGAFASCHSLKAVTIPSEVTSIGRDAFARCYELTEVVIPDQVTSIDVLAFHGCKKTKKVTIGRSVKNIGESAFLDCNALTDVYFNTSSLDSLGRAVFVGEAPCLHLPCEHFKIGDTVVNESTKATFFDDNFFHPTLPTLDIPDLTTTVSDVKPATCSQEGCTGDTVCAGCGMIISAGEILPIDPDAHDWGEWTVAKWSTANEDGVEERVCAYDLDLKHKQIRKFRFEFIHTQPVQWKAESDQPLILTVKNVAEGADDTVTFSRLKDVYVDGKHLVSDTDYTADPGSIILTIPVKTLKTLKSGSHTVKATLKVGSSLCSVESSFTVVQPDFTPNPGTGESGMVTSICVALMLIAAYSAVYSITRKRTNSTAYE